MLHPSYTDLMEIVNRGVEQGEEKVVNSRYSIVLATAKRARQIIDGSEAMIDANCPKPLSFAIEELHQGKVRILGDEEEEMVCFSTYQFEPETAQEDMTDAETAGEESVDAEVAEEE